MGCACIPIVSHGALYHTTFPGRRIPCIEVIALPVFLTHGPDEKYGIRGSDPRQEIKLSIRNAYDPPNQTVENDPYPGQ